MVFAIALILLVVGSVLFHILSPWYLTELASNWTTVDFTIDVTFWVTGFVFVAINLFMAWAVIKYRHKAGARAHYEPENRKLENWLIGVTTVGVAAMLAPGLFVWAQFVQVPEDADEFEAVGQQWHWTYRFPGDDGKLGTSDMAYVTADNPLGVNPDDPNSADDRIINNGEVHLPIGRPVKALLRSKDVLHNFTVTEFRVKMDLVPGLVTYLWVEPTRTGTYDVLCEELCGVGHHTMRGRMVVDEPADFEAWLTAQPTFADTQARVPGTAQAGAAAYAICGTCHGTQGEGNVALNGPKLAGQEAWYLRRQIDAFKNGQRGTHDDDQFGRQMAPMVATLPNAEAIENVIAYIGTLPDVPAEHTVTGDAGNGERLWATCGACHGKAGEGRWATNAPRQAGMSDWYIARQIHNFKTGVRGGHDLYGKQMSIVSIMLKSEDDINDVVAYINTLGNTLGE